MGKTEDTEYHQLEDHVDSFATFLCWVQFLRAVVAALLTQTLWPYLEFLQPQSSPLDFVRTVAFATLCEIFAGVWQVYLDHKQVTMCVTRRSWYALSYCCGLAGSLLYALPAQVEALFPQQVNQVGLVVIGRVLLAFWAGSASEIERTYVQTSSLSAKSHSLLASFERMRIAGFVGGSLLGFASTFLPVEWPWFQVEHIRYPAGIQVAVFLVAACWLLSVFSKFLSAVNGEKDSHTIDAPEVHEWRKKADGCGRDDREKIAYASESLRHWGVFSGLFSNIVLHFSNQVRDVVFPLLFLPEASEFSRTHVENLWGLQGLYALFAFGTLMGFLGREICFVVSRFVSDRVTMLVFLLLTSAGWTLLIPNNDPEREDFMVIPLFWVVSGFVLVSLGQNSLPECSYRLFHRVLGPKAEGFYMIMFLLLGGMGATIAPLWVWETMRIDSALCFGFVDVWLGATVVILFASWSEAVPYDEFMARFVDNFKQKGKIEAS